MSETDIFAPQEPVEAQSRKAWEHLAATEYVAARLAGEDVSVIMVDLSGFKDVNDTIGHLEGDDAIDNINALLHNVTGSFRKSKKETDGKVRQPDIVSFNHYQPRLPGTEEYADDPHAHLHHAGGDEWIILARTDSLGVKAITERLRATFGEFIEEPENSRLKEAGLGLAIGTASTDEEEINEFRSMLGRADRAMQQDKVDQLDLNEVQKRAIVDAWAVLEAAGVRFRDAARFIRISPPDQR